jgi:hypothetical protein
MAVAMCKPSRGNRGDGVSATYGDNGGGSNRKEKKENEGQQWRGAASMARAAACFINIINSIANNNG